jgi:hypothetical protein
MKKLLSRYLFLFILLGCLVSVTNFQVSADPPCPESCHKTCRAQLQACVAGCPDYGTCVDKCVDTYNACIAYCDWVCGPE